MKGTPMGHRPINWNPWTNNPQNYLDKPLCRPDGSKVNLTVNHRGEFVIRWDGGEFTTDTNVVACRTLNDIEAGTHQC